MADGRRPMYNRGYYPVTVTDPISQFPIAMAYVPWQHFNQTYELCKAYQIGTIFPELNKPFIGKRGGCK